MAVAFSGFSFEVSHRALTRLPLPPTPRHLSTAHPTPSPPLRYPFSTRQGTVTGIVILNFRFQCSWYFAEIVRSVYTSCTWGALTRIFIGEFFTCTWGALIRIFIGKFFYMYLGGGALTRIFIGEHFIRIWGGWGGVLTLIFFSKCFTLHGGVLTLIFIGECLTCTWGVLILIFIGEH